MFGILLNANEARSHDCLPLSTIGGKQRHSTSLAFCPTFARPWVAANGVRFPGETFHVAYSRYAANDYGVVRVFIPASNASEEQVVRWARTLPDALSDLFARKATSAALPAFDFRK